MTNNIEVVKLSAYTSPDIIEEKSDEFVKYGEDNDYFQFLIDRFVGSATNQSLINGISKMIYGKGLDATDSNRKPEQYAQMMSLFKGDCLKNVALDFKMLGMASMQVTFEGGKVTMVTHFPMNTLRAEKQNKDGEIKRWAYHPKWGEYKKSDKLTWIKSFGSGTENGNEILVIKPYVAGYDYYTPPDYAASLAYAVLEEEIGDYQINDVLNSFSGTKMINLNNGIPEEDKRREVKRDIMSKLTGSYGEKVILSFNANQESAATIEDIPLNNAPEHYSYLSEECTRKLIVGHRVTSPMLIGLRTGNEGLGNNADEIEVATRLFMNVSIKPLQQHILDAIDDILAINEISLNTYFKTIEPQEFIDAKGDKEDQEEQTGQKLSKDDDVADLLIALGEDEEDGWELIDEHEVDYDREDELDLEIQKLNQPSLLSSIKTLLKTRTGRAFPKGKSENDHDTGETLYKVRYRYAGSASTKSRPFCLKMLFANKLYRKEDILRMEHQVVNSGWGPRGTDTYSIWLAKNCELYKGGGNCKHYWKRLTFKFSGKGRKTGDPTSPKATRTTESRAKADGVKNTDPNKVGQKPFNFPDGSRGFLK